MHLFTWVDLRTLVASQIPLAAIFAIVLYGMRRIFPAVYVAIGLVVAGVAAAAAMYGLKAVQDSGEDTAAVDQAMASARALPMVGLVLDDVPGAQRNPVTGGPVSRGKIDSSGTFVPPAPDDLIAGFGVPSPAIKLGKRFPFASDLDVHLYLYLDKDAYANEMKYFASGGGIQFGGKTSGGTPLKLRLGVGRDSAGGGAGFIKLQIGPDFAPMTPPR